MEDQYKEVPFGGSRSRRGDRSDRPSCASRSSSMSMATRRSRKPFQRKSHHRPRPGLADFDSWRLYEREWKADVRTPPLRSTGSAPNSGSYFPGLKKYVLVTSENALSERSSAASPQRRKVRGRSRSCSTLPRDEAGQEGLHLRRQGHPHLSSGNDIVITYAVNSYGSPPCSTTPTSTGRASSV